jgi:hypothetical protein
MEEDPVLERCAASLHCWPDPIIGTHELPLASMWATPGRIAEREKKVNPALTSLISRFTVINL